MGSCTARRMHGLVAIHEGPTLILKADASSEMMRFFLEHTHAAK